MKSDNGLPPPSYNDVMKEFVEKEPTYRLFLYYNQEDVQCSLNRGISIEELGCIQLHTKNIPEHSIQPGNVPIEEMIKDPNKYLNIVLECDSYGYLYGNFVKMYTSREIWDTDSYMPPQFQLSHEYSAKSIKQVVRNNNKKARLSLLVITTSWNCHDNTLMSLVFSGTPKEECKYTLHVVFKRKFMQPIDSIFDSNGGLVRRFRSKLPPFKSIFYANGKVISSQTKAQYKGATLDLVLKSSSFTALKDIENRYMKPLIPNKDKMFGDAFINISPKALVSIEERSGSQAITVKFQDYRLKYHPYMRFGDPVSWHATPVFVIYRRSCETQ